MIKIQDTERQENVQDEPRLLTADELNTVAGGPSQDNDGDYGGWNKPTR